MVGPSVMTAADIDAAGGALKAGYASLAERLAIEGDPLPSSASFLAISNPASQVVTGGGYGIGSLQPPPAGRAFFVQSVSIWSSHLMNGRVLMTLPGITGIGTPSVSDVGWGAPATDEKTVNAFFRSANQYSGSVLSVNVKQFIDTVGISVGGTPTVYTSVGYTGFTLADDLNFSAAKSILVIGDSRNNGTGPTTIDYHPGAVIKNFYRSQGLDARYILKAYGGSTLGGHATAIRRGLYDGMPKLALIVIDLGTNDAAQTRSVSASIADLTTIVQWAQTFQPQARKLIVGSPPMQDNTFEGNLASLRTAEAAYVTALNDPLSKFFSFAGAFDRTDATNYAASDGAAGTRIHPTDKGLQQMFSGGYSGFIGLLPWLAANLPTI